MLRNTFHLIGWLDQIIHPCNQMNSDALVFGRKQAHTDKFLEELGEGFVLSTCSKLIVLILSDR